MTSHCVQNPQAGLGVYAKHSELEERLKKGWWQWLTSWTRPTKDFVLATVPLDHAITAKTIVADETLGPLYQQFLIDGNFPSLRGLSRKKEAFPADAILKGQCRAEDCYQKKAYKFSTLQI